MRKGLSMKSNPDGVHSRSNGPKHGKPTSNVSGWIVSIVAVLLLAAMASFPLWGQISVVLSGIFSARPATTPITETATDQGISVTIESVSASEYAAKVILRIEDEEGKGRVSDQMEFGHWTIQVGTNNFSGEMKCVDYDGANVAHYSFMVGEDLRGKRVQVSYYSLGTGQVSIYAIQSYFNFKDLLDTEPKGEGEGEFTQFAWDLNGYCAEERKGYMWKTPETTSAPEIDEAQKKMGQVLVPNALHVDIPDAQGVYLSNLAYKDGRLYVQTAMPIGEDGSVMLSFLACSRETGDYFSNAADAFAYIYPLSDGNRLQIEEESFDVSPDELGDFDILVTMSGTRSLVTGNWRVGYTVPEADGTTGSDCSDGAGSVK